MILGIDEVGRGCWAGPLVVGAVVLGGVQIDGLTDSKALGRRRREVLFDQIQQQAAGVGLGWVSAAEIDEVGLVTALRLATKRAVKSVNCSFHEIIIDGTVNFLRDTPLEHHVTLMKKADLLVPSVSAASIVAKVSRDRYMAGLGDEYAVYKFGSHVGYGTASHRLAIEQHGVSSEHRLSIAPLAKYRNATIVRYPELNSESKENNKRSVWTLGRAQSDGEIDDTATTRTIGDRSESAATEELMRRGHEIVDRNWKTKYCEVDIISRKDGVFYFTEVKHRKNDKAGDGIAAITPKKLNQMRYAAKFYAHTEKLVETDLRLIAIATTGESPSVTSVIIID